MHEEFWDEVAPNYDAEICNTLKSDRNDRLRKTLREYATGKELAIDFGCGVGRFLPLLSECVDRVIATDFSSKSLGLAESSVPSESKIEFKKADLITGRPRWQQASFGLLINVLIMPDADHRSAIIKNVRRNLTTDAYLLVVVPSLESALYCYTRLVEWGVREGSSTKASVKEVNRHISRDMSIANGIVKINGTSTKHHLREELFVFFEKHKFAVERVAKVEFNWTEEFAKPPRWLNGPYPWDWLFVIRKQ
jgi:ubiquinone/menaquinone biosynthesis C-methylase UbiE